MDENSLLDALLGLTDPVAEEPENPMVLLEITEDNRTTIPGTWVARRRFGGYTIPEKPVPVFELPEGPRTFEKEERTGWKSMDRMRLRASDKRDTKIKDAKASLTKNKASSRA